MFEFDKKFDKLMENANTFQKIEKLQEEIDKKQVQLDEMKLTAGMMKGFSKTANIAKTCDECGFGVPKYSGRYPKHCPSCDGDMSDNKYPEVPNDVPLDEAVELADKVRATFRTPVLTKDKKNAVVKQGTVLKVVDSTLKNIKGSDGKMKKGMVLYKNTKGEELYIDASDIHAYMREK